MNDTAARWSPSLRAPEPPKRHPLSLLRRFTHVGTALALALLLLAALAVSVSLGAGAPASPATARVEPASDQGLQDSDRASRSDLPTTPNPPRVLSIDTSTDEDRPDWVVKAIDISILECHWNDTIYPEGILGQSAFGAGCAWASDFTEDFANSQILLSISSEVSV